MVKAKENKEKSNKTTNPDEILSDLIDEALNLEIPIEQKQDKTVNKESFDNVVNDVSKEYKTKPSMALAGIFTTLQAGGTNNNKRSNIKITIGEITFESKTINAIIIKNCKGLTPRQLAKFFADQIQRFAIKFKITGNSFIYINRFHSNLLNNQEKDPEEIYWCSDFQVENPNCPEYIRVALRQRYNDKFRKNLKQS